MYKYILSLVFGCFFLVAFAQEPPVTNSEILELLRTYESASPSERSRIDSLFIDMEMTNKAKQIKSICGVDFGMSKEEASIILRNKYGTPMYNRNDMIISFENIRYAGVDFDNVHFLFQSDGRKSYLYSCILVNSAQNRRKANEITDLYKTILSRKYELSEKTDDKGFKIYGGGISPLWNGKWNTLLIDSIGNGNYLTAFHTDVIEYDRELVETFGKKYAVRLIYGPFKFVNEEF